MQKDSQEPTTENSLPKQQYTLHLSPIATANLKYQCLQCIS